MEGRMQLILFKNQFFEHKNQINKASATMVITFSEFLKFYQIFLSSQVKRSLIISNKLIYTSCRTNFFWINF